MRKKTKCFAAALCMLLFASMALGSGSSDSGEDKQIASVENGSSGAETDVSSETDEKDNNEVTVEEQVLYDENDIKITATGLEDSMLGTELKLLIENNSSKSITVQAGNANVNGYMVPTMMSADVASGKKANNSLTFETSGLKDCGI